MSEGKTHIAALVRRWRHRHQPLVKGYIFELVYFVGKLTDPSMQLAVVQQLHRLLPFCVVLPKLCPKVLKVQPWPQLRCSSS